MNITEDKERLISLYLNGDCSSEESARLLNWINQSEKNRKDFLLIKDLWDASLQKTDSSEDELLTFYKGLVERNKSKVRIMWKWVAGVAAVISIAIISTIMLVQPNDFDNSLVSYSVPFGSKSQVVLPDGTKVDLNSGSKLEYQSGFRTREVTISGELFFDVYSDKSNPFIVKTSDFDITVTGTKFNVCTYTDNNFSSTALLEGEITLSASNIKPLILKPGEKVILDRVNKELSYTVVDNEAEVAWKDNKFVFNSIAFPELVKRLERWYDVKLNYTSKELETLLYTGSFKNQETIWQVLDALRLTSPIDYNRTNFREFRLNYSPM